VGFRPRARREQLERFEGLLPQSQGQHLAVTVLHVPFSTHSGRGIQTRMARGRSTEASRRSKVDGFVPHTQLDNSRRVREADPPWRQPRGISMGSLVNSHTNATSSRWHVWEMDSRFALNSTPGWGGVRADAGPPTARCHQPSECYQIPVCETPDLHHKSPDSGDLQY